MICKNCKKEIPDSAVFCPYCAANLTSPALQDINTENSTNNTENTENTGNTENTKLPRKRKIIITVAILIVIAVIVSAAVIFASKTFIKDGNEENTTENSSYENENISGNKNEENTEDENINQTNTVKDESDETQTDTADNTEVSQTTPPETEGNTIEVATTQKSETPAVSNKDLPKDTKEIVNFVCEAVEKTRNQKTQAVAEHTVIYDIELTQVPGGDMIRSTVNGIVSSVAKPVSETLNFSNGTAKSSDGKTVKLLLPQSNDFYLSPDGVTSAEISEDGDTVKVKLKLISEKCTSNTVPVQHASTVGYIDMSQINFGIIDFSDAEVIYPETVIEFTVNSDGYITKADYTIPFDAAFDGKVMGLSATVKFSGLQEESWEIK